MKRDYEIEILTKYNELALAQLEFYHKYCKFLNEKIEQYEKREKEFFELSLKQKLKDLSK